MLWGCFHMPRVAFWGFLPVPLFTVTLLFFCDFHQLHRLSVVCISQIKKDKISLFGPLGTATMQSLPHFGTGQTIPILGWRSDFANNKADESFTCRDASRRKLITKFLGINLKDKGSYTIWIGFFLSDMKLQMSLEYMGSFRTVCTLSTCIFSLPNMHRRVRFQIADMSTGIWAFIAFFHLL